MQVQNSTVLAVRDVTKSYATPTGEKLVLDGFNLEVRKGQFVCIVGPSGAGKTTLLRCLAGLHEPSTGSVEFEGVAVSGPPKGLALVFQDYSRSLFPWMSVADNIALPLEAAGWPKERRAEQVKRMLEAVGLEGVEGHYPRQLSGGMQQRVAIARALAVEPDLLLMDEPFAALDAQTRQDLEDLLLQIREQFQVTVLFVTHDIDEAVYLADSIVVMSKSPSSVLEEVSVGLPQPRDQFTTKALDEYASLRNHVLGLVKGRSTH